MNSPLLRLPAEIRNMIWTFALDCGQDIELLRHSELRFPHTLQNYMSLLFVCRQIHAETALLPYELKTFSMLSPGRSYLVKFLERRTIVQREVMASVKWSWYGFAPEMHSAVEWLRMSRVRKDSW